jgi:hypothetical protein
LSMPRAEERGPAMVASRPASRAAAPPMQEPFPSDHDWDVPTFQRKPR